MQNLIALPHELHLLVAEHAARSNFYLRAGWVASLCLVCHSFRQVVTPILYDIIFLRPTTNLQHLVDLASQRPTPLAHTRVLHVSGQSLGQHLRPGDHIREMVDRIVSAMPHLDAVHGRGWVFESILGRLDKRVLSWVSIADPISWSSEMFVEVANTAARLHINVRTAAWPWQKISALRAEYLIIDALIIHKLSDDNVVPFLRGVEALLEASTSLRRVLLRVRRSKLGNDIEALAIQRFVHWAEQQRDPRIWIDPVPRIYKAADSTSPFPFDHLHEQDTLAGNALWLTGQQCVQVTPQ
ncbi:hypothetical protein EXIGLDRAFT_333028 [Exidia glandulosa HHB12029]|uniref:F-box domain-containing protein n=1 Tax=Exidia glandulosa HHB12029 TaxID=1314781 RepID=A0A165LM22_EXIGL|nr:hypothetical protein EXIGLDRAFT_333028 [Exidia glandulosa HHB12029]